MRMIQLLLLMILLFVLSSCEKRDDNAVRKYFQNGPAIGSCSDYAIELQSNVDPSQWDYVITVHGFVNDEEIAQKLADYLNNSSTSRYRTVQLNH